MHTYGFCSHSSAASIGIQPSSRFLPGSSLHRGEESIPVLSHCGRSLRFGGTGSSTEGRFCHRGPLRGFRTLARSAPAVARHADVCFLSEIKPGFLDKDQAPYSPRRVTAL